MVEVVIDQDTCTGCGTCAALCGDVYEIGPSGKAQLTEDHQGDAPNKGEAPDGSCAKQGADTCPVNAIKVE